MKKRTADRTVAVGRQVPANERALIPVGKQCKECPLLEAVTNSGHGLAIKCAVTRASDRERRQTMGYSTPASTRSPRKMGTCVIPPELANALNSMPVSLAAHAAGD